MKSFFSWGFIISLTSYVVLHLTDYFFPSELCSFILAITGGFVLFFAFMYTPFKTMIFPFALLMSALIIMFIQPNSSFLTELEQGLRQMRSLVSLLFFVPMVSWVLRYKPYIEDVMIFFQKQLLSSKRFYFGLSSVTQFTSYFLLVGCVPVMYQVLNTMLKGKTEKVWESFKTSIIMRSFGLGALWVLSIPSFSYAIQSTGASLPIAMVQGGLISLFGIILATIFLHFRERKWKVDLTAGIQEEISRVLPNNDANKGEVRKSLIEFAILFITLISPIMLLHLLFQMAILLAIPIVIIVWMFIYFVIKRDVPRLIVESKFYFARGVALKTKEMSIILCAGMLVHSLNSSGWGRIFIETIYGWTELIGWLNFLTVLPLIILIVGFLGLSPLTMMVLLGEIIQSIELPYATDLILLSLTLGSSLAIMLSPLGIQAIILSNENKRTPLENSLKENWFFALCFYIIVSFYIQLRI